MTSSQHASAIELETPVVVCPHERTGAGDVRRLGIALGDITIAPRFAPAAR